YAAPLRDYRDIFTRRQPAVSPLFPYTTLFRSPPPGGGTGRCPRTCAGCFGPTRASPRVIASPVRRRWPIRPTDMLHSSGRLQARSEEHTSKLQSRENLVCRLLLEKKNIDTNAT